MDRNGKKKKADFVKRDVQSGSTSQSTNQSTNQAQNIKINQGNQDRGSSR